MERHLGILIITWLHVNLVQGNCPIAECSCIDGTNGSERTIDCRDKGLVAVPNITATNEVFKEITFSAATSTCRENTPPTCSNKISHIPSNAFSGLQVRKIDFSTNVLTTVEDDAFNGLETVLTTMLLEGDDTSLVPWVSLTNLTNLVSLTLESFTDNGNGITSFPQDFPNLETLVLHSLKITFIAQSAVMGKLRKIKRLEILDNPDFVNFPVSALRQLTTLEHIRFVQNGIQTLQALGSAFQSHNNLKELDFSHNQIHTLQTGCFDFLENRLEYLGLQLNYLDPQRLGPIRDGNWQNLQQLILDSNDFSSGITPNLFKNMPNLANLNLQQTNLPIIQQADFVGLNNLHFLHLSGNHITQIETGSFLNTPNLKELYLDDAGNTINKLNFSSETTAGLSNLQRLDLARSRIETDSFWNSLPSMPNLSHLLISETGLSVIPDLAFQYNTKLQTIEMKSNSLTQLTQAQIHGPGNSLKSLDLSLNAITLIDNCAVEEWENSLNDLYMGGNPLHCDCKVLGLYHWAKQRDLIDPYFKYAFQAKCNNKGNADLLSLATTDLTCTDGSPPINCQTFTTSTTTTEASTTFMVTLPPLPVVTLSIDSRTTSNIQLSWSLSGSVQKFIIKQEELGSSQPPKNIDVDNYIRQWILISEQHKDYEICISATTTDNRVTVPVCKTSLGGVVSTIPPTESPQTGLAPGEVAAIGACTGILVILIIVILFFLIRYQSRPKYKDTPPVQFTNVRQPMAGAESKSFSKPKKSSQANGDIIISAISSGKTAPPGSPNSRMSDGSYQYLNENQMIDIQPHLKYENGAHGVTYNHNPSGYQNNPKQNQAQGYLKGEKEMNGHPRDSGQNGKPRYDKTPSQTKGRAPSKPHSYVNEQQHDSTYTNDISDRPLPKPRNKHYENNSAGFLNHGFDLDSPTDHTYNEIPETQI